MTWLVLVWLIAAALVPAVAYHFGRAAGLHEAMVILEQAIERMGRRNEVPRL